MARTFTDTPEPRYVELAKKAEGAEITVSDLAEKMEGSDLISVDENEGGTKVAVSFDLTGASAGQSPRVNEDGDGMEWGNEINIVTPTDTSTPISEADFELLYGNKAFILYNNVLYSKYWSGELGGVRGIIYYTIGRGTGTRPTIMYISTNAITRIIGVQSYNVPEVVKDDDDDYAIQFDENGTIKEEKLGTVVSGVSDGTNWTSLEIDGVLKSIPGIRPITSNTSLSALEMNGLTDYTLSAQSGALAITLTAVSGKNPEYHAFITTAGSSAVTLPSGTIIKTNDTANCVISTNTVTLASGITVEMSIQNGLAIVYNWSAV